MTLMRWFIAVSVVQRKYLTVQTGNKSGWFDIAVISIHSTCRDKIQNNVSKTNKRSIVEFHASCELGPLTRLLIAAVVSCPLSRAVKQSLSGEEGLQVAGHLISKEQFK